MPPDPQQNATGTSMPSPDPNAAGSPTHYYDSTSKSIKKISEDKPESFGQTIWRNLTPQLDTSQKAKGPEHQFDSGSSPQAEGEEIYKENFGSPLEQAYGHAKRFLQTHEKNLSEKVLQPFREGVDRIGDELQEAGETGHTKSGGQLTGPTRALVGTVGELMKQVPVGRDVKSTVQALAVPPELGPEGKALSKELNAAERAKPNLEGIEHIEISPAPKPGAKAPNLGGIEHVEISPAPKAEPQSIFTPEGAKPLADRIGAKVVGSVATGKTSADPYGINRGPKDLDLRIDGAYDRDKVHAVMGEEGFEHAGGNLVSPEEAKKAGKQGKSFGPGWNRSEVFERTDPQTGKRTKVEIWHSEPEAAPKLPVSTEVTAASKAKERTANLKSVGIGLTEMDPNDARSWVGYTNQKSLKVYRGVDDPSHSIEAGDYVTTSKESAQNYGKYVQEVEASPEELRYVRGHQNGDPKRLGQGGQTELIYAPKKSAPIDQARKSLIEKANSKDWYHVPPVEGPSAYSKRGQFFASTYKDAEFYGRPLDEQQNPQIKNPLVGDEAGIAKELGIAPQKEGMSPKEIAEHDRQWGTAAKQKGYDSILLMAPSQYTDFQTSGKIPRSLELQHLDKLDVAPKTAPKNPVHEKLFADATAALGPEKPNTAAKTTLNASGESSASQEAINRAANEKAQGIKRYRIDSRSGKEIPLFGPDAVDAKAGPFDYIVSRDSKGQTVLDMGRNAFPLRKKL